jgi:very-short-patch-repair endonuclease
MPHPTSHARARALRRTSTDVEQRLWSALRSRQHGLKFRRQHPLPPFVADFACVEARLVIELDGGRHGGPSDSERDSALAAKGWRVLRYWNSDVVDNLAGVLTDILSVAADRVRGQG